MSVTAVKVLKALTPDDLEAQMTALIGTYQPYGQVFRVGEFSCIVMVQGTPNINNNASAAASVLNNDVLAIKNSAGADSHNATATVAGNAITAIKFAATVAMVDNGDAYVIPVTGVYATTATITVAAGVVTAIVLS